MHEFSLAQNIVEIVEHHAQQNNISKVNTVVLEIGTLSGIEIPALDMALESLRPHSVLKSAEIINKIVQAVAVCNKCDKEFQPEDFLTSCPSCGSYTWDIVIGQELKVKSITGE